MPTILVTGANGFIGRELCRRLVNEGWNVRGAVRRSGEIGLPADVALWEIDDLTEGVSWKRSLEGVDFIVHLAAHHHIARPDNQDVTLFHRINVEGSVNFFRQAAQSGVQRFLYLSTAKIYGDGGDAPFREIDPPKPADPYGKSKMEAEKSLQSLAGNPGTELTVLRPPLVYGPGVKANFLRLMEAVYRGVPLPLGAIRNKRSLVYIGNLIDAIFHCLVQPEAAGQDFLVSDGEDLSIPELLRGVASAMDRPCRIFPFPPTVLKILARLGGRGVEIERMTGSFLVDSRKIRNTLSWDPPFRSEEGLQETVNWFLRQKHSSS